MNEEQQTVLVTGGAGYIGTACVAALITEGYRVVVFDNFSTGQRDKVHPDAVCVAGDLLDKEALAAVFRAYSFSAVMHFAAKKAVGESEENPSLYFENNVVGSIQLLNAMVTAGVPKIIFSSTAAVYGVNDGTSVFTEDALIAPPSIYGTTKYMIEQCIHEYARTGKLQQYGILRYFNVAGDAGLLYREQAAQNVFPRIAAALESGGAFNIFGTDYTTKDGTGVRDYIHLSDLVDGHVKALMSEGSGTYNLGSGTGYSVQELVDAFERISGKKINVVRTDRRAGDPAVVIADASRAAAILNWHPTKTLNDMVTSCLEVYGK